MQYFKIAAVSDSRSALALLAFSGILNRLLMPGNSIDLRQLVSYSPGEFPLRKMKESFPIPSLSYSLNMI